LEKRFRGDEMKQEPLNIKYSIKGIQPYDRMSGWVCVLLIPMDPLNTPKLKKKNLQIVGPMGPIPEEAMEEMQQFFSKLIGQRSGTAEEDREIVLILENETFRRLGWKYDDQIGVTFEKLELKD